MTSQGTTTKNIALTLIDAGANKEEETFVTQRAGKIVQNDTVALLQQQQNENRTLQSTLLLQKKKEMQQVQTLLEKKRLEFAKRMEECREKQEELKAKQKQIRERVLKFEKFLRENDAKRQRANLKAQAEKKLREQKEQELIQLNVQLQQENIKGGRIIKLIKNYQVYERYLQSVVDILPPDYLDVNEPHINDIIMRHKTLIETNDDLMKTVLKCQDEIDKRQKGLQELVKEKNDKILVYNSMMGTQQKKFDKLKQEVAYLEQKQEEHDKTGMERMRVMGESKLAINNLFDRVSQTRGRPTHHTTINAGNNQQNQPSQAANSGSKQGADEQVNSTQTSDPSTASFTLMEKLNMWQQKAEHFVQLAEKNAKAKMLASAHEALLLKEIAPALE